MSPKMRFFKTENSGKLKIYKFLKNYAGIDPKHPQTLEAPENDMEIQGPVPREAESSTFRIFQWLLQPSTSISCVLEFSICWILNDGKIQVSNLLFSGQKKSGYLCNFSWKGVKHKSSKAYEIGSASGNHVPLVSVRWPWLHGEAWKLCTPILMLLTVFKTGKPASALPRIAHVVAKIS